jgi:hypothetical protein
VRKVLLVFLIASTPSTLVLGGGCGGSLSVHDGPAPSDATVSFDVGLDHSRLDAPIHVDAPPPCDITIDAPQLLPAVHVGIGTHVEYDSNPPSSGPHYPIWAAYQVWDQPVQREYYVHDLEHGAIVFVYKCPDGGACPEIVDAMKKASDGIPDDPLCDPSSGVRVRTVITPDPLLDVPIAAAAWGWVYRANCLDPVSLAQFAKDHYAQGPENLCANGQTSF